jgi:hypothetical protein
MVSQAMLASISRFGYEKVKYDLALVDVVSDIRNQNGNLANYWLGMWLLPHVDFGASQLHGWRWMLAMEPVSCPEGEPGG